jgi:LEA14-like dessication related protein
VRSHRLLLLVLLTVMLLAGGGCGFSVSRTARAIHVVTKAPVASVKGAQVTQTTPEGSRVEVTVELVNANAFALPLRGVNYQLSVAGLGELRYSGPPEASLPANGRQTLTLPAAFPGEVSGAAYSISGSVAYEPPGGWRTFLTESSVPLPTVRFSGSGQLP